MRNYERILAQDFWLWMWNSFKVSSISALLAGLITLMSAFAFSRFRWAGRSQLLLVILLIQVFPAILAMVEDKAADKQVSGSLAPREKVNLSTTAKDVQRIQSEIEKLPEVREEKIRELQAQIDRGTYSADADKIAEKMVGESLLDNLS